MNNNKELLTLIVEMTKAARCCQQDAVFCQGITFTQFYILELISSKGLLKLSDLHNLLSVEKSTSTRLIDPLIKQGLVIREKSISDNRAINLKLSDKGQEVYKELWDSLEVFLGQVYKEIPAEIREEVFDHVMLFVRTVKKVSKGENCCN